MNAADIILKVLDAANPLAGVVAEFVAGELGLTDKTIDAVQQTVSGMSGGDQVKLKQIAADLQDHLAQYGIQLQTAQLQYDATAIVSVNGTLQADARGDSWLQKNHHAIESLITVCMVVAIYFVLPLAKLPVPAVPESVFMMLATILGVSTWQRGVVAKAKVDNANPAP